MATTPKQFRSSTTAAAAAAPAAADTTSRRITDIRTGTRTTVVPETVNQSLGAKVIDVSIRPWIRPREVQFTAHGMKPSTRLWAFFDGEPVKDYIIPTNSSFANTGSQGSFLTSNSLGSVYGIFKIPNSEALRFRTGQRIFRICDSIDNSQELGLVNTSAESEYNADGLHQTVQDTVISTKVPRIVTETVTETRTREPPSVNRPGLNDRGGCCFDPKSLVTMADGSTKQIKDVVIGDRVQGSTMINTVLGIDIPKLFSRYMCSFNNNWEFISEEHPIMTDKGWSAFEPESPYVDYMFIGKLAKLDIGSKVLKLDGSWEEVVTINYIEQPEDMDIYNLLLDGDHTYYVEGYSVHNKGSDPIAQSFTIPDEIDNNPVQIGVFVTKIDLFFQQKDATLPVIVELREMSGGIILSSRMLPYSQVILFPADVNVSEDGSVATQFVFTAPVFLYSRTEYAFVVKPGGTNPNYKVWTSKLGEEDLLTGFRINQQPATGVLLASSNDSTWSAVQDEDIKFTLYRAEFNNTVTGNIYLVNEGKDFLTANNSTGLFDLEAVRGETRLTVGALANGTPIVGQKIYGLTSTTYGTITNIAGGVYRLKDVSFGKNFTAAEVLRFRYSNNFNTGATGTATSYTQPTGKINFYDIYSSANTLIHIANTAGGYIAGEWIQGMSSNTQALIHSIDDLQVNVFQPDVNYIEFANTNVDWYAKTTSTGHALGSTFDLINMADNNETATEKRVVSKSKEISDMTSNKSFQIKGMMTSESSLLSPAIDLSLAGVTLVGNIINNVSTNETGKTGGDAKARYITRIVTLDEGQDAEDLKVYATVYKPAGTDIKVYYKILHAEDSDDFSDFSWVEMGQDNTSTLVSDNVDKFDYKEFSWSVPTAKLTGPLGQVRYTNSASVVFTGFKRFMIKAILLGSDTSVIPRMADIRVLAMQK